MGGKVFFLNISIFCIQAGKKHFSLCSMFHSGPSMDFYGRIKPHIAFAQGFKSILQNAIIKMECFHGSIDNRKSKRFEQLGHIKEVQILRMYYTEDCHIKICRIGAEKGRLICGNFSMVRFSTKFVTNFSPCGFKENLVYIYI